MGEYSAMAATIDRIEFDQVFTILENGVVLRVDGMQAPEVHNDAATDVRVDGDGWSCVTGMTGQYGYRGAVMHPSEHVGEGIAECLAEMARDAREDGYVLHVAMVLVSDGDDTIGWAIVTREHGHG